MHANLQNNSSNTLLTNLTKTKSWSPQSLTRYFHFGEFYLVFRLVLQYYSSLFYIDERYKVWNCFFPVRWKPQLLTCSDFYRVSELRAICLNILYMFELTLSGLLKGCHELLSCFLLFLLLQYIVALCMCFFILLEIYFMCMQNMFCL